MAGVSIGRSSDTLAGLPFKSSLWLPSVTVTVARSTPVAGSVSAYSCSGPRLTRVARRRRPAVAITSESSIASTGESATTSRSPTRVTFIAPTVPATTNPFVPTTGIHCSVQRSVRCGVNPRCLNGEKVLPSALWLNRRPDCSSEYWPSVSVSNDSQIIPCRDSPQIQIFPPGFSSRGATRAMPKSFACQ